MQKLIRRIHRLLIKKQKSLAVAESCTGGLLSQLLTGLSGSSGYFILGVVAYHNRTKGGLLRIPASVIAQKGAVSEEVACKMAQAVRRLAGSDFAVGITGIAGPAGDSPGKPVGTVFIAVTGKNRILSKKFLFKGNRLNIRQKAALKALYLLKSFL